jgi:hypothetical protein
LGAPAAAGANDDVAPTALRVGVLEEADNPTHQTLREAFLETLARAGPSMAAMPTPPARIAAGALRRVTAQEAAKAAADLARRSDLDLILVSGFGNWQRLVEAGGGTALVLGLSPDCAETVEGARFRAFPRAFLLHRLLALHAATGFKRLGIMVGGQEAPTGRAMHTLLADIQAAGESLPFAVYPFADMLEFSTESCREAIDSLFFDAVDALLFDGTVCFEGKRGDLQEHLELLRSRGILPLSLLETTAAANGALLAPWTGDSARLGRDVALDLLFSPPDGPIGAKLAKKLANLFPTIHKPEAPFLGATPGYALRLDAAENMGFAPSPGLLILTREVMGQDKP